MTWNRLPQGDGRGEVNSPPSTETHSNPWVSYNPEHPWGESGALWFYDVTTKTSHLLLESFGGGSMEWQPAGTVSNRR